MPAELHIGPTPPNDGREWDAQCARCGSSADYDPCEWCAGEGYDGHDCGEDCCMCRYPDENVPCQVCDGRGGFTHCLSSADWCEANPLPGKERTKRGELEWYTFDAKEKTNGR